MPPTSILKPGSGPSVHQSQTQQMQLPQNQSQSNHSQQSQNSQNQMQHNQHAHSQNQLQHNQNQHQHNQNQHQHNQNQHQHNQNQHQHSQNQLQHTHNQMQHNHSQNQQQLSQNQQPSPADTNNAMPPAPPERGSSFAVMSMRVKESKRVSFNDAGQQHAQSPQQQQPPNTLVLDESIREDPNVSYLYS